MLPLFCSPSPVVLASFPFPPLRGVFVPCPDLCAHHRPPTLVAPFQSRCRLVPKLWFCEMAVFCLSPSPLSLILVPPEFSPESIFGTRVMSFPFSSPPCHPFGHFPPVVSVSFLNVLCLYSRASFRMSKFFENYLRLVFFFDTNNLSHFCP